MRALNCSKGFTLIEMVTVIIILGILAIGTTRFLQFGAQIFAETSDRDELISSARFALERLNREVRNALPNSAQVTGGCLTFRPIYASTLYTEIPVAPEAASNKITVVKFDQAFDANWQAVVYPLTPDDLAPGSNKVFGVASRVDLAGNEQEITLDSPEQFASDSPTRRIYFIKESVSYCLDGTTLKRDNVLMAQDIDNSKSGFVVENATLQRNGYVQVTLHFNKHDEQVSFTNEIQVANVP